MHAIQAFVAVVETGSIHAAARALGLSQPALSKSLRALENELAAPLLTRSSQGAVVTAYGKTFYQHARVIADELRKAEEDVAQLRGKLEGKLTIGIAPASTMRLAPMAISDFRQECPDVELHVVEGIWPAIAEPLREGRIDLAIGPLVKEVPRKDFTVERLLDVQMAIVMRPQHPLVQATSLRELLKGDWLHQGAGDSASIWIQRIFTDQNLNVPPVSVESRSLIASILLLQTSDLIGVLPLEMLAMPTLKGTLVAAGIKEPIQPNKLGLMHRAGRPLTRVAQIFATHTRRTAAHLAGAAKVAGASAR